MLPKKKEIFIVIFNDQWAAIVISDNANAGRVNFCNGFSIVTLSICNRNGFTLVSHSVFVAIISIKNKGKRKSKIIYMKVHSKEVQAILPDFFFFAIHIENKSNAIFFIFLSFRCLFRFELNVIQFF